MFGTAEKFVWLHWKALFVVLVLIPDSWSLKSMKIHVPEVVQSGDTVTLSCQYDLEDVPLYSIRWYRNEWEFYRYVPKESPPFRAFSMEHVNVDISKSGPTEVTLLKVRRELTGDYKCEVSSDGPLFHTEIQLAHMTVAELPKNGNPVINIEPSKVEIGKKIKAQCQSPLSDPPANITWFINNKKLSPLNPNETANSSVKILPTETKQNLTLKLSATISTIQVTTMKNHFKSGSMKIKCQASIYSIWNRTVESFVRDNTPQLAPVVGSSSSQDFDDSIFRIENKSFSSAKTTSPFLVLFLVLSFIGNLR